MNGALWLLIRLQMWGWLRLAGRGLTTVRGALLTMLVLSLFVPMIGVAVFMSLYAPNESGMPADQVARFGPAVLLLYVFANLILSPSNQPVYFSPPEVQFLFPGPFSRRQVLLYKVVLTLLVTLPTTLLLGAVVRVRSGWAPAVLLGLLLISTFMMLLTIALGLLGSALGESLRTRSRWAAAVVLLAGIGGVAAYTGQAAEWDGWRVANAVLDSTPWRIVAWPLASFFEVLTAKTWDTLPVPALVALAANAVLLFAIFGLDVAYEEQSAAGSAAIYAKIMRMRGQQVTVEPTGKESRKRFTLPALPFLGGIGPVVWRQALTAYRSLGRLALIGLIVGGMLAVPLATATGEGRVGKAIGAVIGISIWLSIFLPMMVPFDFRGDIDRMATLKALPVSPWMLALGQLVVPTALLTAAGWVVVAAMAVRVPEVRPYGLAAAACVPAFTAYVIAVENAMFLFFPTRIVNTPGDFQAAGRSVLVSFGKMFALAVPAGAGGLGWFVGFASGSVWLGVAAGCALTAVMTAVLVLIAGFGFIWFDVGRTAPQ